MFEIKFVGVKESAILVRGIQGRIKTIPNKMTDEMATKLKQRISARIPPRNTHAGHNTPESLKSMLHKQIVRGKEGGHRVWMENNTAGARNLPWIVNFGPNKEGWWIPMPGGGEIWHPGFQGKDFWQLGFATFMFQDYNKIIDEGAKKIVKG